MPDVVPPFELVDFSADDWSGLRCVDCSSVPALEASCAFYTARRAWETENGPLTQWDAAAETRLPDEPWHLIEEELQSTDAQPTKGHTP